MRVLCLAAGLIGVSFAAGREPKAKPADYRAHAVSGSLTIAADYLIRSFGSGTQTYWTPDYLVVEVALYSSSRDPVQVNSNAFALRFNGKKDFLYAQTPGMVVSSMKYQDWERRRGLEVGGGAGDAGVTVGGPTPTERFPGDPSGRRLPKPPRVPETEDRSGIEKEPVQTPAEIAAGQALPEGSRTLPIAGYLYFPYTGKTTKLKSVVLIYQSPSGAVTLQLK
ncbi:MAG: hypothetical protein ACKV22_00120 [Bryobacteraceae bacterium]